MLAVIIIITIFKCHTYAHCDNYSYDREPNNFLLHAFKISVAPELPLKRFIYFFILRSIFSISELKDFLFL